FSAPTITETHTLSLHDALPIWPHFVTTVHGMHSVSRYSAIMCAGERVIAVSDTVRDYIHTHYPPGRWPHLTDERITVIPRGIDPDRKSTRLNSSHVKISYAVFC